MELGDLIIRGANDYGIQLDDHMISQFMKYMALLKEWNEKINLTAITDDYEIVKKHFIDSLSIIKSNVIKNGTSIIDVGTGAGFPGIPIKIVMPEVRIVLLDSLNKRVKFLNTVIEELMLKDIVSIHGRAEEMSKLSLYRETFDVATARAVANMSLLSEYCLPYVKRGGYFIAMKGPSGYEEVNEAKKALSVLGGTIKQIIETKIVDEEINHNIIVIEKTRSTPPGYPRRFAIIEKNPIK
jgi:16S rRNA (guanine527-N7)-methyltransferase